MSHPPPTTQRDGDYVMNFPVERPGDRDTARDVMKRNGCRSVRFELHDGGLLIAHGYISRMSGYAMEDL